MGYLKVDGGAPVVYRRPPSVDPVDQSGEEPPPIRARSIASRRPPRPPPPQPVRVRRSKGDLTCPFSPVYRGRSQISDHRSLAISISFVRPLPRETPWITTARPKMAYSTSSAAHSNSSWQQEQAGLYGSAVAPYQQQQHQQHQYPQHHQSHHPNHSYPYQHLQSQYHLSHVHQGSDAAAATAGFVPHQHQQQPHFQPLTPPPSNNDQCQDIKFDYGGVNSFYHGAGTFSSSVGRVA